MTTRKQATTDITLNSEFTYHLCIGIFSIGVFTSYSVVRIVSTLPVRVVVVVVVVIVADGRVVSSR